MVRILNSSEPELPPKAIIPFPAELQKKKLRHRQRGQAQAKGTGQGHRQRGQVRIRLPEGTGKGDMNPPVIGDGSSASDSPAAVIGDTAVIGDRSGYGFLFTASNRQVRYSFLFPVTPE
jgi:hypothetical protein